MWNNFQGYFYFNVEKMLLSDHKFGGGYTYILHKWNIPCMWGCNYFYDHFGTWRGRNKVHEVDYPLPALLE